MATPIPENRARFSLDELLLATGGALLRPGASEVLGVSTDTRAELRDKAFVALVGERFDGHELLEQAVRGGAKVLVVEREITLEAPGVGVVRVDSTLRALGALARFHRRRWGGRVVAIGGSAGKTTTRSAVSSVLEALRPGRVHATRGNLNNRVGLPLTLLGVTEAHELCVLEVGTNQTGEVPELASVCEPNVAVLTLVDLEHSEGLGDLDAIEAEEGALVRAVGAGGVAIGNGDDARVRRQIEGSSAGKRVLYGTALDAGYRIKERTLLGPDGARVVVERAPGLVARGTLTFDCPLLGEPGALAAAAALAVAEQVTERAVDEVQFSRALTGVGESGRLRLVPLRNGAWLLDDSYNANPASVQKSIETARELAGSRGGDFWLVLGEMRELGGASAEEHERMGLFAATSGARGLFAVAGDARSSARVAESKGMRTWFFEDAADVARELAPLLAENDVAVIKASRGVRAERVVEGLIALCGRVE